MRITLLLLSSARRFFLNWWFGKHRNIKDIVMIIQGAWYHGSYSYWKDSIAYITYLLHIYLANYFIHLCQIWVAVSFLICSNMSIFWSPSYFHRLWWTLPFLLKKKPTMIEFQMSVHTFPLFLWSALLQLIIKSLTFRKFWCEQESFVCGVGFSHLHAVETSHRDKTYIHVKNQAILRSKTLISLITANQNQTHLHASWNQPR